MLRIRLRHAGAARGLQGMRYSTEYTTLSTWKGFLHHTCLEYDHHHTIIP